MLKKRATYVALAVAAALPFAGCAGGGSSPNSSPNLVPVSGVTAQSARKPHSAMTWRVLAGGKGGNQAFEALDFYDEAITIDAGDSVTWVANGGAEPHTVTFLGPRSAPPPPNDPTAPQPFGGKGYDGDHYTSSGFIAEGQTYTLRFPKPGTYTYYCILHQPEMEGTVVVQPAGAPYPHTQSYYTTQGRQALNETIFAAVRSLRQFPYADGGPTLTAGIAPGLASGPPSNATVLRFLARDRYEGESVKRIALGTTLTWVNQANNEPHTVTFPAAGQAPPENPFSPPMGGPTYDGSALVNSGVMPPGASFSVTFTKQGTYTYYCLFHDGSGMIGTIVVQ